MQNIQLENTDLSISRLAFGTGSLHHLFSQANRIRLIETVVDLGITHFDTSPYYGAGLAEKDLGKVLPRYRDRVTIASKVGLYPAGGEVSGSVFLRLRKLLAKLKLRSDLPVKNWSTHYAQTSLDKSLRSCRTDYLDLLLLHEPVSSEIDSDRFLEWIQRQQADGKIRYWGVAGPRDSIDSWLVGKHPLAQIVQTQDSLEKHEADFLLEHGRKLQLTYGYLNAGCRTKSATSVIELALQRNTTGAIILSTRKAERLASLARHASQHADR